MQRTMQLWLNFSSCHLTLQVAGVHMDVLRTATVFTKNWLSAQIDAVAACPMQRGKGRVSNRKQGVASHRERVLSYCWLR